MFNLFRKTRKKKCADAIFRNNKLYVKLKINDISKLSNFVNKSIFYSPQQFDMYRRIDNWYDENLSIGAIPFQTDTYKDLISICHIAYYDDTVLCTPLMTGGMFDTISTTTMTKIRFKELLRCSDAVLFNKLSDVEMQDIIKQYKNC